METNEMMKATLWREAEAAVQQVLESLQEVKEGELKVVEEQVLSSVLALGRQWMAAVLGASAQAEQVPVQRQGACGHEQRLVELRPKQVLTLLGKVSYRRPYYQCQLETAEEEAGTCTHGEAPADALWGLNGGRSTPGVQQAVSYLAAQGTLQEAAESFSRLLPRPLSARQVLTLMQPVGEVLAAQEDAQVQRLFEQAAQALSEAADEPPSREEELERLYIEMDGITARLRRGSVPMEEKELKRAGDVYREVKVGAVFQATRGPERSALAPGRFVDQASEQKSYVARRSSAETFGKLLYSLAVTCGLLQARQVLILGDGALWIWRLAAEHFPGAVQIVDLWHAREHVWKVAKAVFGVGTPQAWAWAERACSLLVQGNIEDLVMEIALLPVVSPVPGASRSVPEIERDYFISNAARMRYPAFRAEAHACGQWHCRSCLQNGRQYAGQTLGHALDPAWTGCSAGLAHCRSQRHVRRLLPAALPFGCLTAYNFFIHPLAFSVVLVNRKMCYDRLMTGLSFYAMTMPGLETLAFSEVRTRVPDAELVKFARGIALFRTAAKPSNLLELRTVEDVFVTLAHIRGLGHERDALRVLHSAILNADVAGALALWQHVHGSAQPRTWRVVSQKAGTHDFRRIDAGNAVSDALRRALPRGLRHVADDADCEFWLWLSGSEALIGLRLSDATMRHRSYKREHLPASLRPTVAAAMGWLSQPTQEDSVLDPLCGVGTILIERALLAPLAQAQGGDIRKEAVTLARRNALAAGVTAAWHVWDARALPLDAASVTRIITNLPFGKRIGTQEANADLYTALVGEFERVLVADGVLVTLTSDDRLWDQILRKHGWRIVKKVVLVVLGQPASIFVAQQM